MCVDYLRSLYKHLHAMAIVEHIESEPMLVVYQCNAKNNFAIDWNFEHMRAVHLGVEIAVIKECTHMHVCLSLVHPIYR